MLNMQTKTIHNLAKTAVLSLLTVLLVGCATKGTNTQNYVKHDPKLISNEIVVNQPYQQVWDRLVKELSKSFYVINNIDKESRIINLSFSSPNPTDFVDCGETSRSYTQGGKTENYNYNVADSSTVKLADGAQEAFAYFVILRRSTSLEGRANIYLAPLENDNNKTKVAVNSRYMLTIDVSGERYAQHVNGNIFNQGAIPHVRPTVISFNTNKPVDHNFGVVEGQNVIATCFSSGKLEQEILMFLQ